MTYRDKVFAEKLPRETFYVKPKFQLDSFSFENGYLCIALLIGNIFDSGSCLLF